MAKLSVFLTKKRLVFIGMIFVGVTLLVWKQRSNATVQPLYQTTTPKIETVTKTLSVSGQVDAKEKVRLRFMSGGKTTYIGVKNGDFVKKWQTIARIDAAALQKQLQQDLNNYLKERWDFEEHKDSIENQPQTLTERRFSDKTQWDLENSVLTVEIRDIAMRDATLYTPIAGVVTNTPTTVAGMQLSASDYFEVVNPETLLLRAVVDEADIAAVAVGQKAEITLDAFETVTIETTVTYIGYTSIETASGTAFIVEFLLDAEQISSLFPDQILRIGMNGDASIILAEKENILTIPAISIIEKDEKTHVQVLQPDNTVTEVEVKLGLQSEDLVEVISGISDNDLVIVPE